MKFNEKILILILASILLLVYIFCKFSSNDSSTSTKLNLIESNAKLHHRHKLDEIQINFAIEDIYRIDITCEYVTKHLSKKVSDKYKNNKKCSLSTLDDNESNKINELLTKSIDYKAFKQFIYEPIYRFPDASINSFNVFKKNEHPFYSFIVNKALIKPGGYWIPPLLTSLNSECNSNDIDTIAFIVPYMNRIENLNLLIVNLHNYLTNLKHQFVYRIIVAEQYIDETQEMIDHVKFNKGQIYNAAIKHVLNKYRDIDCIVLHDVDIIPIVNDSSIDYRCKYMPVHLTNRVFIIKSKWDRLYNQFLTGGILSLRPQHFVTANGFSNGFSGWGGEDDVR